MWIFVCSPLRGDFEGNRKLAEGYCRELVLRGHNPFAPHVYYTRFLDENEVEERRLGIHCGLEILRRCDQLWIHGTTLTPGMIEEIVLANHLHIPLFLKHPLLWEPLRVKVKNDPYHHSTPKTSNATIELELLVDSTESVNPGVFTKLDTTERFA